MTSASILIVEDERIIARGIEKQLKGMGYSIAASVSNGEDALLAVAETRPDMILMDINLGAGLDGVETAGIIRKRENVPIVFLTAFSDDAAIQRAKLTEPYGYVLKPYDDRDLQTAIEIGLYKHQANRRLQENEQWLAATLGSIGDGVIATDRDGCIRFINTLAESLTGWNQQEVVGEDIRKIFCIVNEVTGDTVQNPIFECLQTGKPGTLDTGTLLIDRNGVKRPIEDSAAPICDVTGRISGAVLVFRDVSERRQLEMHLRQSQKMDAIGRLAGGIAHDINNIMAVILGYAEILYGDGTTLDERNNYLREISEAGKRAATLTQQILAFSRKQTLMPTVVNLNAVISDMYTMLQRLVGADIVVETKLAAELGNTRVDASQIGQVLLNLAANARDAIEPPTGGRLTLATSNTELGAGITEQFLDVSAGKYVVLSASDTGTGIPASLLPQVFEPFFTTKSGDKGTGLGLATVYGIVKQSGGHIEVSSIVGEGTTFRIYLPLIDEEINSGSYDVSHSSTKGTETILIVDDEPRVRQVVSIALKQDGYSVLEAENGQAALEKARNYGGEIHLLVSDLMMPTCSGQECARQLLQQRPDVRVLFISGFNEDPSGITIPKAAFLTKPFSFVSLREKVKELLNTR